MDTKGRPTDSGTGFIISSSSYSSFVLTSLHVVSNASRITVDLNHEIHDISAGILSRDRAWDIALLKVDRGNLEVVKFAREQRELSPGNIFAVAGYFKLDDQIGFAGQDSHLLYPGTISSLSRDRRLAELANLDIEKGLSGSPVFDPASADVVGMVESSHSSESGGYAVTNAVLLAFLASQHPTITVARGEPTTRPPLSRALLPPPSSQRSLVTAEPTRTANEKITPQAILANPRLYDGKEVRVSGTVRNVVRRQSASGNDYVTLDVCDSACIHVFAFGTPNLVSGRQLVVRGTFSAVRRTGSYSFYNEITADDDAL